MILPSILSSFSLSNQVDREVECHRRLSETPNSPADCQKERSVRKSSKNALSPSILFLFLSESPELLQITHWVGGRVLGLIGTDSFEVTTIADNDSVLLEGIESVGHV